MDMRASFLALILLGWSSPAPERIVFLSEEPYGLHIMNADGSESRQLVKSEQCVLHFDAGPLGIAYVTDPDDDEMFRLSVLDPDTGKETSVWKGIRFAPKWSADGKRLAFMNHAGRWRIMVTATGELTDCKELAPPVVTRFESGQSVNDGALDWSPDGRSIVFHSNRAEKNMYIYTADIERNEVRQLTSDGRTLYPVYSPDGKWIAFQTGGHLHRMRSDGTEQAVLTKGDAKRSGYSWFPGGSQLLFVSDQFGQDEVCVLNLADGTVRNLSNHAASDRSPALSANGQRILFVSDRDGNDEIYVMNAKGGDVKRLTENTVRDAAPTWFE